MRGDDVEDAKTSCVQVRTVRPSDQVYENKETRVSEKVVKFQV